MLDYLDQKQAGDPWSDQWLLHYIILPIWLNTGIVSGILKELFKKILNVARDGCFTGSESGV